MNVACGRNATLRVLASCTARYVHSRNCGMRSKRSAGTLAVRNNPAPGESQVSLHNASSGSAAARAVSSIAGRSAPAPRKMPFETTATNVGSSSSSRNRNANAFGNNTSSSSSSANNGVVTNRRPAASAAGRFATGSSANRISSRVRRVRTSVDSAWVPLMMTSGSAVTSRCCKTLSIARKMCEARAGNPRVGIMIVTADSDDPTMLVTNPSRAPGRL